MTYEIKEKVEIPEKGIAERIMKWVIGFDAWQDKYRRQHFENRQKKHD